jgi:predicted nucleic acid-binding protein
LKILLDTTYLMPAIGVSVRAIPADTIIKLLEKGELLAISEISIFELSAKGAKYSSAGTIPQEKVLEGIRAIVADEQVAKVPSYDAEELRIAVRLRDSLKDFIDCLILSCALLHSDVLLTEDKEISEFAKTESYKQLLSTYNKGFAVRSSAQALAALKG